MRPLMSKALTRAAALAGALALAACAGQTPPPAASTGSGAAAAETDGTRTGTRTDPVRLALLVPRTAERQGPARLAGALVNAARMRMDTAAAGVTLTVHDTGGEPARARRAAERAVAEGADLLLGPLFARNVEAVAPVARAAGVKVIAFSTDTRVAGPPVWLAGFLKEWEARRILAHAAAEGRRRVALFLPDTPYGAAAERGADAAERAGVVRIVARARYPGAGRGIEAAFAGIQSVAEDFAAEARAGGAEAVLIPAAGQELQAAATFLDYHEIDPAEVLYLGLGNWQSRATLQEPTLVGGRFPAPDPDRFDAFAARYAARHGTRPPALAALGHDAVTVAADLVRSARAAGRSDPFAAPALTRAAGFEGALGALRFTPDGRNRRGLAILEVGERSFGVREPAPAGVPAGS